MVRRQTRVGENLGHQSHGARAIYGIVPTTTVCHRGDVPDPGPSSSITITAPEVARLLNISETLVRHQLRAGRIPGMFRVGRRVLVHRAVLLEAIEELARGHPTEPLSPDRVLERAFDEVRLRRECRTA